MDIFVREAVGVFDTQEKLDAAVAELEGSFPRMDMSVLGSSKEIDDEFGFQDLGVELLEDYPNAPRQVSVRPEEKIIGAGVLVGCSAYVFGCAGAILTKSSANVVILFGVTMGSIIGAVLGLAVLLFLRYRAEEEIERQIKRGGLLLWVRTANRERERLAQSILRKHGARDVHVHSIL